MLKGMLLDPKGNILLNIQQGQELTVGRGIEDTFAGFNVEDDYVSRNHGTIKSGMEIYFRDNDSKNGSYVNGKRLKANEWYVLSDGDFIRLGRQEFLFRVNNEADAPETGEIGAKGFCWHMKNSLGGRKLQIDLKNRGCVEYQIRMVEENPGLAIAGMIPVSGIENDSILCDIGGFISLREYILQEHGQISGIEIVESILRLIKLGEEHLLNCNRYIISPDTLFINEKQEIRLIYLPCQDGIENEFAQSMSILCDFLKAQYAEDNSSGLEELAKLFGEGRHDVRDYLKLIYHFKDIKLPADAGTSDEVRRNKKLPLQYIVTLVSFVLFMVIFWIDCMTLSNLGAIALILVGMNILMYGIKKDNKELCNLKKLFAKRSPG